MKTKFILIIAMSMLLGASPSFSDVVPDEQWVIEIPKPDPGEVPYWGFWANGGHEFHHAANYLVGQGYFENSAAIKVTICNSFQDSNCSNSKYFRYSAILSECKILTDDDCIKNFSVTNKEGKSLKVVKIDQPFQKELETFRGDSTVGLPSGGLPSLYSIPELPHLGGDKYLVVIEASGEKRIGDRKFSPPTISANIYPVQITENTYPLERPKILTDSIYYPSVDSGGVGTGPTNVSCPIYTISLCAKPYPFNLDVKFTIEFKLSNPIVGWLHGRVQNASARVSLSSNGSQSIEISAQPITLPSIYGWIQKEKAPTSISDYYKNIKGPIGGSGFGCTSGFKGPCSASEWISVFRSPSFDDEGMREFLLWNQALGDKASKAPTTWSVMSMPSANINGCADGRKTLLGIVATNATNYLSGPPSFNATTSTLDYKVAAPHFLANGEVFKGSYDLLMDSEFARCIYGYSKSPIEASVSIVSEGGELKSNTTSVEEKEGWLRLSAQGFTFSNPTLKVKLTQEVSSTLNSNKRALSNGEVYDAKKSIHCFSSTRDFLLTGNKPSCPAGYNFVLNKTITCKKGKSIKKIVGEQPDCPRGYTKIATSIPIFKKKSGIKTLWCLNGNVAIQVAGLKPSCPTGMTKA